MKPIIFLGFILGFSGVYLQLTFSPPKKHSIYTVYTPPTKSQSQHPSW